jgi:hypothetical protein
MYDEALSMVRVLGSPSRGRRLFPFHLYEWGRTDSGTTIE